MFKLGVPLMLAAFAAAAPQLPPQCTNLPQGFCGGAMVPNVAYKVPAMYGCTDKCKEMNIWCQANKEGKEYEYLYCCGDNCVGFPKEKKCKVEGKEYTVGQSYEVTLKNGDCVTLWCLNEDEHVACKGKECGSKPELTPPPPQVCKKPTPCNTCPPVPPKPQPTPQCSASKPCPQGYECIKGQCYMVRYCEIDNHCPRGYVCLDNMCWKVPADCKNGILPPVTCRADEYWNTVVCACMPLQTRPLNPNTCAGVTCDPVTQILNYENCKCVTVAPFCDSTNKVCAADEAFDTQSCTCVKVPTNNGVQVQCNVATDCVRMKQCSVAGCTCESNRCVPQTFVCSPLNCADTEYFEPQACMCLPLQTEPVNPQPCAGVTCDPATQILNYDNCQCVTIQTPEQCKLQNTDCPAGQAVDVQQCMCVPATRD